MNTTENTAIVNEDTTEGRPWILAARQFSLAREMKKQVRKKKKAMREEENAQFRTLVNHNR